LLPKEHVRVLLQRVRGGRYSWQLSCVNRQSWSGQWLQKSFSGHCRRLRRSVVAKLRQLKSFRCTCRDSVISLSLSTMLSYSSVFRNAIMLWLRRKNAKIFLKSFRNSLQNLMLRHVPHTRNCWRHVQELHMIVRLCKVVLLVLSVSYTTKTSTWNVRKNALHNYYAVLQRVTNVCRQRCRSVLTGKLRPNGLKLTFTIFRHCNSKRQALTKQ
jgi:hypothetical protein